MSERSVIKKSQIWQVRDEIVAPCKKCGGSGINLKEAAKVEAATIDNKMASDEAILEVKVERKKEYMRRNRHENPANTSYGLCKCYIKFEAVKGMIIADIPHKFFDIGYEEVIPREISVEGHEDKKQLHDFLKMYIQNFRELKKNAVGITLMGKIGTGRTFVSQFIGAQTIKKRYSAHYIPFFELTKIMRSYDNNGQTILKEIMDVDLLIIDEIGLEHPKKREFSGEIAHQIQRRTQSKKVTIFGVNGIMSQAEMIDAYGGAFYSVVDERNIHVEMKKKAINKNIKNRYINKVFKNL